MQCSLPSYEIYECILLYRKEKLTIHSTYSILARDLTENWFGQHSMATYSW